MKRLPRGALKALSEKTGIGTSYLSDIVSTSKRPGRERAKVLEYAAKEMGKDIPATLWLYGSKTELRQAVAGNA